jgi:hypothetical protein
VESALLAAAAWGCDIVFDLPLLRVASPSRRGFRVIFLLWLQLVFQVMMDFLYLKLNH